MQERRLEIVTDAGNQKTRFTITSERITIKFAEADADDEIWFTQLALATAIQIPIETPSLRGTIDMKKPYFTLSNKSKSQDGLVTYKFESLTAKLAEKKLAV